MTLKTWGGHSLFPFLHHVWSHTNRLTGNARQSDPSTQFSTFRRPTVIFSWPVTPTESAFSKNVSAEVKVQAMEEQQDEVIMVKSRVLEMGSQKLGLRVDRRQ